MKTDTDDLAEPVLPPDATPAEREFARQIAAALDYNDEDCDGTPAHRCALSGPTYTPCTLADCDLELGGGCVLRGPPA